MRLLMRFGAHWLTVLLVAFLFVFDLIVEIPNDDHVGQAKTAWYLFGFLAAIFVELSISYGEIQASYRGKK